MQKDNAKLLQFSPSIFWDVRVEEYDIRRDKKKIIERVMNYGTESDEILLYKLYSFNAIKKIVVNLENLNEKTVSYLSFVFNIKRAKFKSFGKIPWYVLENNDEGK
ncbi:MAG: hypothetical protein FWG99_03745 [Treponema sp.]|nr:hypothetical protein [Treponema sp.]